MLLNLNFSMVPINLSMSITFVNPHGLPIRIARIRSILPSSVNDLTQVSAKQILSSLSQTHWAKHLSAAEMMLPP